MVESRQLAGDGESILGGVGPLSTPLTLYLMQIALIVAMCQTLGFALKRFRQPRVIAEVIGGIILGPSFLGQIDGFTETLFPDKSLEALKLTATLGLVFFLFIVGLELDPRLLKMNAARSFSISLGGQGFTWALSILVSHLMYTGIDGLDDSFATFLLFIGVAMSVTAFPVLSRILTETRLLQTRVGISTISSAAFDDITAWSMLALVIALVNAGSPIQALYVFLTMVAFVVFMLTVGRVLVAKVVTKFNAHENITYTTVCVTFLMVLLSGWFTQIIGVDAIFGAFIAGLIIPRDGDLAVVLTEKIEDIVTILLLPIYFAISGLKTDFSALNTGKLWGYAVLVILGSCIGKIAGCSTAAKLTGMKYREAFCVGVLMNTRGLVELIILNAGLDAGVINREVFAIMVLMAVVTTCMTSPLAVWIYPPHLRTAARAVGEPREGEAADVEAAKGDTLEIAQLSKVAAGLGRYTDSKEFATDILNQIQLLVLLPGNNIRALTSAVPVVQLLKSEAMQLHAVRLVELTDRFSADMAAANSQKTLMGDPMMAAFKSFCRDDFNLKTHIIIAAADELHEDALALAAGKQLNTVLVAWDPPVESRYHGGDDRSKSVTFLQNLLNSADSKKASVAVVVDKGGLSQAPSIILVPFMTYSASDCEALLMAMALSIKCNAAVVCLTVGIAAGEDAMAEGAVAASHEDASVGRQLSAVITGIERSAAGSTAGERGRSSSAAAGGAAGSDASKQQLQPQQNVSEHGHVLGNSRTSTELSKIMNSMRHPSSVGSQALMGAFADPHLPVVEEAKTEPVDVPSTSAPRNARVSDVPPAASSGLHSATLGAHTPAAATAAATAAAAAAAGSGNGVSDPKKSGVRGSVIEGTHKRAGSANGAAHIHKSGAQTLNVGAASLLLQELHSQERVCKQSLANAARLGVKIIEVPAGRSVEEQHAALTSALHGATSSLTSAASHSVQHPLVVCGHHSRPHAVPSRPAQRASATASASSFVNAAAAALSSESQHAAHAYGSGSGSSGGISSGRVHDECVAILGTTGTCVSTEAPDCSLIVIKSARAALTEAKSVGRRRSFLAGAPAV